MTLKRKLLDLLDDGAVGTELTFLLDLRKRFLRQQGWLASIRAKAPVDHRGQPIPWITYGSLHFLEQRLHERLDVFEYGSGNSTIWLSKRVRKVVSVEHEEGWYRRIQDSLRAVGNVDYRLRRLEGTEYAEEIFRDGATYDVVIVDGRHRVACARAARQCLAPGGVIVWDNAEREKYRAGYDDLRQAGFRRLDFYGLAPINRYASVTAIFYRPDNCLGI